MNAPWKAPEAQAAANSTMAFARHLLRGATPPNDSRITAAEWLFAAQYAVDADDTSDLDFLIEQLNAPYPRDEPYYSHRSDERPCAAVFGSYS